MLKAFLWTIIILIAVVVGIGVAAARKSTSVPAPAMADGNLPLCGDSPNCVCSEMPPGHEAYIEPIKVQNQTTTNGNNDVNQFEAVQKHIESLGGSVRKVEGNLVQAEFKSRLFGFVDDLLLQWNEDEGVYGVRSSSRVGESDLGVNRKRVESLRQLITSQSD